MGSAPEKIPLQLRLYNPATDDAFVYNSWLKSYCASPEVQGMPRRMFFSTFKQMIAAILSRPTTRVLVLCDQNDPLSIFGYGVFEGVGGQTVLHFAFVKYPFRRFGLFKLLLESAGVNSRNALLTTSRTHATESMSAKGKFTFVFNPLLR